MNRSLHVIASTFVAAVCDQVTLVAAGLPLRLKG